MIRREVPLRIAVVGPASAGKTELSRTLAEELGVEWLAEGLRERLEVLGEGPLAALGRARGAPLLAELHAQRFGDEQRTDSFVADTSCLDPVATGLMLGWFGDPERGLFDAAHRAAATYDAVFVLPGGALAYERDGVRPADELGQLAYGHLLRGLLGASLQAARIFELPPELRQLEQRLTFVREHLAGLGLAGAVRPRAPLPPPTDGSGEGARGKVYLVGAGPGTPELMTLRAVELLKSADVVAHDRLVPPALLAFARPDAELLAVGHRGRGSKDVRYRIHPAVLERAARGLKVVRLKAGDPLIFGRGGEEAEALFDAGITFEIVPGVSAALGAAAAAGIPLTHREHASDVTFATGHDLSSGRANRANFAGMAAGRGTLVLYMATRKLEANLARLVELGRDPATPAAYVAAAARLEQRVVTGTLADLAGLCAGIDRSLPALVIVGDVVTCRARVAWCEQRPLAGRRFLLGRGRPGPSKLATELRELGASVVEEPRVTTRALERPGELDACMLALEASERGRGAAPAVLLVTSAEAARRLAARFLESGRDLREFPRVPLFALGAEARAALCANGLLATETSPGHCAEGLASLGDLSRTRVFVLGASRGRPSLMEDLAPLVGAAVFVPTYVTETHFSGIDPGPLDAGLFMASSIVRELFDGPEVLRERLREAPAFAIGPKTRRALEAVGQVETKVPDCPESCAVCMVTTDRREDLVAALVARFGGRRAPRVEVLA